MIKPKNSIESLNRRQSKKNHSNIYKMFQLYPRITTKQKCIDIQKRKSKFITTENYQLKKDYKRTEEQRYYKKARK